MLTSHPKIQPKLKNAFLQQIEVLNVLQLNETNKNQPPENSKRYGSTALRKSCVIPILISIDLAYINPLKKKQQISK